MAKKHRILIAEDHTILREGLRALLTSTTDLEVMAEAGDGRDAVRLAQETNPDLALIDLSMPRMNGTEAIREIKKLCPGTKIIALTVHKTDEYVFAALDAGADGYLLKDASHSELLMAVRNVLSGSRFLSPRVSATVIEGYLRGRKSEQQDSTWENLTKREKEILKLVTEGYKNREVARYLYISQKTVEKHRANLMKKLQIHSLSELIALALEKGLINR
jgi:two-component system, NarL family, response regulator NreC